MLSTTRIDRRLGYFQAQYNLNGNEVRLVASKQPKLITYNLHHVKTNSFVLKEEMGFSDEERKQLLLRTPKLFMLNQKGLLERFNYIHNTMKIPHEMILRFPHVLLSRNFRVKQRHTFLEKLGRAQYDPTKENYVPITALVESTDNDFCKRYAKCNVVDFNLYLKTI
ncbi:transcription termination factor 3, mitochondrial isoform X2 [Epargyreus clarus]